MNEACTESSEALSYIVGAVFSDGCLPTESAQGYPVIFTNTSQTLANRFCDALHDVGLTNARVGSWQKTQSGKDVYRVQVGTRSLYSYLIPIKEDMSKAEALVKAFPYPFLSAYFDCDGTVGHRSDGKPKLVFVGTNEGQMRFVHMILEHVGLHPRLHVYTHPGGYRGVPYTMIQVALMKQGEVKEFLEKACPIKRPKEVTDAQCNEEV
jgi:intein-encoded DNA endonuclease-like protein